MNSKQQKVTIKKSELTEEKDKGIIVSHLDEKFTKACFFYKNKNFTELEVFPTLWEGDSLCLPLIIVVIKGV